MQAGEYAVEEVTPLTWQPVAPIAVTVPPAQNPTGVNFVNVQLLDGLLPCGGFGTPVVGSGNFQYNPSGSPWSLTGTSGVSGNGSAFTAGNPDAPEGSQVAFLQGVFSGFRQLVNFITAGTYTLRFLAAQRGNVPNSSQGFDVLIDGNEVGIFKPVGTSYRLYTTNSFTVTAGSHQIAFLDLDVPLPGGRDNTALIDAVSLQLQSLDRTLTIPEDVGAGDWTVRRNGDNLEVSDRDTGLVTSEPLGPCSLTVSGALGRPTHLTVDLSGAPLDLPGGITFVGRPDADNTLRLVLGDGDNTVSVVDTTATVNGQLRLSCDARGGLTVVGGAGDNTFRVSGTPLT